MTTPGRNGGPDRVVPAVLLALPLMTWVWGLAAGVGADRWIAGATGCAFLAWVVWAWPRLRESVFRILHPLPFAALALIGSRLAGIGLGDGLFRGAEILAVGFLAVVANDYFDRVDDGRAGGRSRPVDRRDMLVAQGFAALVALRALAEGGVAAIPLAAFVVLALVYHAPVIRLKRLLGVSYLCEGAAAALALLHGAGRAVWEESGNLLYPGLAFAAFFVGSMIKDAKDVDQDAAAGIGTVYTAARRKRREGTSLHLVVTTGPTLGLLAASLVLWMQSGFSMAIPALFVLAVAPQVLLLSLGNRRLATSLALIAVSAYLAVMAAAVPPLMN